MIHGWMDRRLDKNNTNWVATKGKTWRSQDHQPRMLVSSSRRDLFQACLKELREWNTKKIFRSISGPLHCLWKYKHQAFLRITGEPSPSSVKRCWVRHNQYYVSSGTSKWDAYTTDDTLKIFPFKYTLFKNRYLNPLQLIISLRFSL